MSTRSSDVLAAFAHTLPIRLFGVALFSLSAAVSFAQGLGDLPSGPAGAACKRSPCPAGNATPCCLDYDGLGDKVPANRKANALCAAIGYWKFVGSTCYTWTFQNRACFNESALFFNNENPKKKAPNCYHNHKYRNCQNLDMTALELKPSAPVMKFGETISVVVRNNTPGNFTCLAVTAVPAGARKPTIVGTGVGRFLKSPDCGGYRIDHFTDPAGKRPGKHYEEVPLKFTAPKARPGECKVDYQLNATNGGLGKKSASAAITVRGNACTGWNGTIKYEESVHDEEKPNQLGEYSVHDWSTIATYTFLDGEIRVTNVLTEHDDDAFEEGGNCLQREIHDVTASFEGPGSAVIDENSPKPNQYWISLDGDNPTKARDHHQTIWGSACILPGGKKPENINETKDIAYEHRVSDPPFVAKADPRKPNHLEGHQVLDDTSSAGHDHLQSVTWSLDR